LAIPVLTRATGDWETVYLAAARNLRSGADLLDNGSGYVYPPFGALVAVPFTFLPRGLGLTAWVVVNVAAVAVMLVGAWRLTGGRALPGRPGTGRVDHAAFWLGGLCAAGFILDAAANWQTDLIIGGLLVGGAWLLATGRGLSAGVAFGAAAAFKCTPLLFAPYLLWKRQFAGAIAVVVVAVGLNVLPDLFYPPTDGKPRVVVWKDRFLAPMADRDRDPGVWASAVGYNHSLAGVNLRWFAYDRTMVNRQSVAVPKADRLSANDLKQLNRAIASVLGLVALVSLWRRSREIAPGPVFAAELGVVFALMLLLSPMSSKPHFGILLLPQLALVRAGFAHRDRVLLATALLVGAAGLCTGKDIVGRAVYELLLWNGLIFGMTMALFLGSCHTRFWYAVTQQKPEITPSAPARLAA
jgi:hypothetical protein